MKLPGLQTTNGRLLRALAARGDATAAELAADPAVLPRVKRKRDEIIAQALADLAAVGCATHAAGVYAITDRARYYLDGARGSGTAPDAPIVPPARHDLLHSHLNPKYLVSTAGRREGADDFRSIPSRHT